MTLAVILPESDKFQAISSYITISSINTFVVLHNHASTLLTLFRSLYHKIFPSIIHFCSLRILDSLAENL